MRSRAFQIPLLLFLTVLLVWLLLPVIDEFRPPPGTLLLVPTDQGNRECFLVVPGTLPASGAVPLILYLQGFDHPPEPSGSTRVLYRKIARSAVDKGYVVAFPRGKKGAFPDVPHVLAWYPRFFHENRLFLRGLISHISRHLVRTCSPVYFAGFSNGAYFGSLVMLLYPDAPYDGYWFDGGGTPCDLHPHILRKPVALSWGARDRFNAHEVEQLYGFLSGHGWDPGATLASFPHSWAHIPATWAFPEAVSFLRKSEGRSRTPETLRP